MLCEVMADVRSRKTQAHTYMAEMLSQLRIQQRNVTCLLCLDDVQTDLKLMYCKHALAEDNTNRSVVLLIHVYISAMDSSCPSALSDVGLKVCFECADEGISAGPHRYLGRPPSCLSCVPASTRP